MERKVGERSRKVFELLTKAVAKGKVGKGCW